MPPSRSLVLVITKPPVPSANWYRASRGSTLGGRFRKIDRGSFMGFRFISAGFIGFVAPPRPGYVPPGLGLPRLPTVPGAVPVVPVVPPRAPPTVPPVVAPVPLVVPPRAPAPAPAPAPVLPAPAPVPA